MGKVVEGTGKGKASNQATHEAGTANQPPRNY